MGNNASNAVKPLSQAVNQDLGVTLGERLQTALRPVKWPLAWLVYRIAGWGVGFKVRLLLILGFILPALAALVLVESHPEFLQQALALALIAAIVGYAPISKAISYLLVGKELADLERFCLRLKEGDYGAGFDLPHESEDEHELLALKRNLNWMAHVISHRESWLHAALEGANQDRNRYEFLSNIDPLTGLANRRRFEQRLSDLAREADLTGREMSLIFIDCDRFKNVNDRHGHQTGDLLLQRLAAIIRRNVRQHIDLPFRYGGDEFGVICLGTPPQKAVEAAERIRGEFLSQSIGRTTLSLGVAGYVSRGMGNHEQSAAQLIKRADKAAYQAKARGGNTVVPAKESET